MLLSVWGLIPDMGREMITSPVWVKGKSLVAKLSRAVSKVIHLQPQWLAYTMGSVAYR